MLLASVDAILGALGFDAMTDITNAATMALDAAEAQLSTVLDTDFTQGSFVDTFYVEEPPFRSGPAVATEFRLSHGMVSALTQVLANGDPTGFATDPVAVYSNGTGWAFAFSPGQNLDVSANSASQFDTKSKERGVVRYFKTRYQRTWVQITYAAGFAVDPLNPASYDLTTVPDWLQQAARINALIGLADSPALSEASVKLDTATLARQYNALTARKVRYAPMSILPL